MTAMSREMVLVVLIGFLLPGLASAKTVVFGSCGDGLIFSDRLMQTKEGIEIMNKWKNLKLVAWSRDSEATEVTCPELSVSGNLLKLDFNHKGEKMNVEGEVEVVHNNGKNNYMDVNTYKGSGDVMPTGLFQASRGQIKMYVHYLSETEVAIKTCRSQFLSSTESFYVFSSHDYSHLDEECMLEKSGRWDNFIMVMAPQCS